MCPAGAPSGGGRAPTTCAQAGWAACSTTPQPLRVEAPPPRSSRHHTLLPPAASLGCGGRRAVLRVQPTASVGRRRCGSGHFVASPYRHHRRTPLWGRRGGQSAGAAAEAGGGGRLLVGRSGGSPVTAAGVWRAAAQPPNNLGGAGLRSRRPTDAHEEGGGSMRRKETEDDRRSRVCPTGGRGSVERGGQGRKTAPIQRQTGLHSLPHRVSAPPCGCAVPAGGGARRPLLTLTKMTLAMPGSTATGAVASRQAGRLGSEDAPGGGTGMPPRVALGVESRQWPLTLSFPEENGPSEGGAAASEEGRQSAGAGEGWRSTTGAGVSSLASCPTLLEPGRHDATVWIAPLSHCVARFASVRWEKESGPSQVLTKGRIRNYF